MGIHLRFRPWPKASHSFSRQNIFRACRTLTAMTRTSVSLALIIRSLYPCATACLVCTKILMLLLHGCKSHTIQADCVIAHSTFFLGHVHCVRCAHINNFASQEIEELSLIVVVSQEVLPVWGNFSFVCNPTSGSHALLWPCFSFQTWWLIYIKNNVCSLILGRVCLYSGKHIFCCIFFRVESSPKLNHQWSWHQLLVLCLEVWD